MTPAFMPSLRRRSVRAGLFAFLLLCLSLRLAPLAHAAITSATKTCVGPGGASTASVGDTATCTLTLTFSPVIPASELVTITAGTNYTFTGATCTATPTPASCTPVQPAGAAIVGRCTGAACDGLVFTETILITQSSPDSITQTISSPSAGTATATAAAFIAAPGTILFASPTGSDATTNICQTRANPCSIYRAVTAARDGETIRLLAGEYAIPRTVQITKLLILQPDGGRVILRASPGVVIFEVTAQGSPGLHVIISNFTMGGNFQAGSTAPAIRLIDDNYTEISTNIIGAEDLPINNGIILSNSDHTNIHDNTIQGNTRFVFTPVLIVGQNQTGFGIVTVECFGGTPAGVSDSVTIRANLFTNMWLAGVWLCSDGAGFHTLDGNTFRNNHRGIALKDVTNTQVVNNILTDERSDGIILYGASLRSTITGNTVESHIAPSAAGIRIGWIADPIVPLSNSVTNNFLVRDTVGIHVFGARTTVITGNKIKISGARTAILLTPSTAPGDPSTQPRDTEITGGNEIIFSGACTAVIGCGIRLVGVTVPVLATDNDWGLRRVRDVEGVVFHAVDDPALGFVTFTPFRNMVVEAAPPAGAATPGAGAPPAGASTGAMPGAPGAGTGAPSTVTIDLPAGCNAVQWPGPSDFSVADAAMGIVPPQAQRSATIWRKENGDWRGWSGSPETGGNASDVFLLRRDDNLLVCVSGPARWMIPTQVGGP